MENVREPKIDYSVVEDSPQKEKALTMGGGTLSAFDTRKLPPLFRKERLSEEEKIEYGFSQQAEPQQTVAVLKTDEVPLFARGNLTPEEKAYYAAAQQPVGPQIVAPQSVAPEVIETPRIVPVSSTTPQVMENSAMNNVAYQPEVISPYGMSQAVPTYQTPDIRDSYGISSANDPEGVVAAIDTRVATPMEPREPMLQTPEEFQMSEPVEERKQDPLVEAAVAIEGTKSRIDEISTKFIETINASNEEYKRSVAETERRYNERIAAAQAEFEKSMLEENKKLNTIGNQIATVQTNNQRDSLNRVREAVNNQSDLLNGYNGGIYNAR